MTDDIPTVRKYSAYLPMSLEQAMDAGLLTEDEARAQGWTPPPPIPRWTRMRWRLHAARDRARLRIGSWIAGVDLDERDDW